ncbi:MAG: ATP-binding protein [Eubacteriales bacterium]|nr:ATP-binding protein [Eubacteriales bacterium]
MKTTLGCIRKADKDFHLIEDGDKIAIGLSGGKDSILLVHALSKYRMFSNKNFSIHAFTIRSGYGEFNCDKLRALCESYNIPYTVHDTQMYDIIFNIRKEKSPCSLCAKMRRGILCDLAKAAGCNKIALGHHRDDAVETLLMSLLYEGRLHTFAPKSYMSRSDITVIRPLIYLPEAHIIHLKCALQMPVEKNTCPVDGQTGRQQTKELIQTLTKNYPKIQERVLHALQNYKTGSLWEKEE